MIQEGRTFGRPILIDPKGDDYSRYKDATVITPNRNELAQVVGKWNSEADLFNRAQNLRKELNLEKILLTRSEEGMTLFDDDGAWTVPAHAREVYDVSGRRRYGHFRTRRHALGRMRLAYRRLHRKPGRRHRCRQTRDCDRYPGRTL